MTQTAKSSGPTTTKSAFTHRSTHPLVLDLLLVKEFGAECIGWEPATLWSEIQSTWHTTVSEVNRNKIHAIRICHSTDTPYEKWEVFEKVCLGLYGLTPSFDVIQRHTPQRCAGALDMMAQVRKHPFSSEIHKYVGACMLDHGVAYGPESLGPCNPIIAPLVGASLQNRVRNSVERGVVPTFDGTNEDDVQIMKSISIKDFQKNLNTLLLSQINSLFEGK
jgi:hypothetical protein